jgi:hypothetical protein
VSSTIRRPLAIFARVSVTAREPEQQTRTHTANSNPVRPQHCGAVPSHEHALGASTNLMPRLCTPSDPN